MVVGPCHAKRDFGNVGLIKEVARDNWGMAWLDRLFAGFVAGYGEFVWAVNLQRLSTHEGDRVADGAQRQSRCGVVDGHVGVVVSPAVGPRFGSVGLSLGRFVDKLLYGITAKDVVGLTIAAGIVLCLALAASYVPARRAVRVDPMTALRRQ
jgi:putative ABC transport system permease protein